jgi:GNAT superfamily N-acetyltransferase
MNAIFDSDDIEELFERITNNNFNAYQTMKVIPGASLDSSIHGLTAIKTNQPFHLFNMYFESLGINKLTTSDIEKLKSQNQNMPFCIELTDKVPNHIHKIIEKQNTTFQTTSTNIYYDIHLYKIKSATTKYELRRLESKEDLKDWIACFKKVWPDFGDPKAFEIWFEHYGFDRDKDLQSYTCFENNQAIGIATLHFNSGVVGPFNIAVIPEKQKHGAGQFILNEVLKMSKDRGYRYVTGSGSDEGLKLYKKLDIKTFGTTKRYFFN